MNLRDQFQQGMEGELTKRQSCDYPPFIVTILKLSENILIDYVLCHSSGIRYCPEGWQLPLTLCFEQAMTL